MDKTPRIDFIIETETGEAVVEKIKPTEGRDKLAKALLRSANQSVLQEDDT